MTEIWNAVLTSIRADFGDLPSTVEITQVVLRLTLAALLGGLLGFEREQARGKLRAYVRTC
jgi:putative Mg2+ transporter-C (MgtC) family protein